MWVIEEDELWFFLFQVFQSNTITHHPEERSSGKVCILFYSGQDTEDETHQDHEEAAERDSVRSQ